MITLEELNNYYRTLDDLRSFASGRGLTSIDREALDIACKMLNALIVQLESQAVSFTP